MTASVTFPLIVKKNPRAQKTALSTVSELGKLGKLGKLALYLIRYSVP